jgi:uncharacterized protein
LETIVSGRRNPGNDAGATELRRRVCDPNGNGFRIQIRRLHFVRALLNSQKRVDMKFRIFESWMTPFVVSLLTVVVPRLDAVGQQNLPAERFHIDLERPGDREFVRDLANLITEADEQAIREQADKLLSDKATPIIVVTIDSMSAHGGAGLRIETFARLLFDQWGIGQAKLGKTDWNTGILLLVSKNDRQARIELGAGWKREKDALCRQIMDDLIIPHFKRGEFSAGIVAGVDALDKMARDLELPKPSRPWWQYALMGAAIALGVFTVVSLIRRGMSGWAWLFWGVVLSIIGVVLYQMMSNSRSSGGGGGFSGGSFGGGFSGGGGASGSW